MGISPNNNRICTGQDLRNALSTTTHPLKSTVTRAVAQAQGFSVPSSYALNQLVPTKDITALPSNDHIDIGYNTSGLNVSGVINLDDDSFSVAIQPYNYEIQSTTAPSVPMQTYQMSFRNYQTFAITVYIYDGSGLYFDSFILDNIHIALRTAYSYRDSNRHSIMIDFW
jgi:hypothetical protein